MIEIINNCMNNKEDLLVRLFNETMIISDFISLTILQLFLLMDLSLKVIIMILTT